ncbi:MAG: hypothetical protein IKJ35_08340 [Clostridia bacterium]|nr:hypothetical protein [Clostridia bacterium]
MRNLTLKRTKTFVACLGKMKVYIEDSLSSDIEINGIHCRKLGELKNGEEKTFQIDEGAAKVFVIADKLSKNYCNEYYQIPEGTEDVVLSGKNRYNPANGNAFCFDNNDSEEIIANRKKNTKKGLIVLIIAAVFGVVLGFVLTSALLPKKAVEPKTFSQGGLTVTLTNEFKKFDSDNHVASFSSAKVAVFAVKDSFSMMEGLEDYTLDQYLDLALKVHNLSSQNELNVKGLKGFVYDSTNPDTKDEYRYFSYVYKSDDAFWIVQFAVKTQNADRYEEQIVEWAKSVTFFNKK